MHMLEDVREFQFPTNVTRRERHEFSKAAGCTLQAFAEMFEEGGTAVITPEIEAALIMIAARRVDPSVTFDDAMDHDGWTLAAPEEEPAAPLEPPKPATTG